MPYSLDESVARLVALRRPRHGHYAIVHGRSMRVLAWRSISRLILRSSLRAVVQVLKKHCRDPQHKRMPIVSQAKPAWIPAQFPIMAVNYVRDRPDQGGHAHN